MLLSTALDPIDLVVVGPLEPSRHAGYTMGFLFLRGAGAVSSALTCSHYRFGPAVAAFHA